MRRRSFVFAGVAAVAWPLSARSQQVAGKLPTIGILGGDASAWSPWIAAFADRLGTLGWVDKRTITIESRYWEGRLDRAAEIAAEYVQQKLDVIVATGSVIPTLKRETKSIPIVFAIASDPVGQVCRNLVAI